MNDLRTAAQQALHALEGWDNYGKWVWPESALEQAKRNTTEALAALRAALAQEQAEPVQEPDSPERRCGGPGCDMTCCQPVQEPVAWVRLEAWKSGKEWPDDCFTALPAEGLTPLYTAPPKAEPLTDEEIERIWRDGGWAGRPSIGLIRAVERALEEKNGR